MAKKANRDVHLKQTKTTRRRLTEHERKMCVAAYLQIGTYLGAAKATGFSLGTIKNCVTKDPEFVAKYNKKRAEEMQELFGALSVKGKSLIQFANLFFAKLTDKDTIDRLSRQDLEKVARIFGITIDKFMALHKMYGTEGFEHDSEGFTINIVSKQDDALEDAEEYYDED